MASISLAALRTSIHFLVCGALLGSWLESRRKSRHRQSQRRKERAQFVVVISELMLWSCVNSFSGVFRQH